MSSWTLKTSLENATITNPTISGGTIDNTIIGGSTRAAGSFTDVNSNGKISGSAAAFTGLVSAQNGIAVSGNVTETAIGNTLILKQGANGKTGTVVANGASLVTASTNAVTTNSGIILTLKTPGGTVPGAPPNIASIAAGSQFVIKGTALDASTYNYHIIESA